MVDQELQNKNQQEKINRDTKLNKVLERMLLTSTKGVQKAFFKLRFHARNHQITVQQNILAAQISGQKREIATITGRVG